jgi:hypothetical protein
VNNQKLLGWIVIGAFLSGCGLTRDWTTRQTTAATAAAACAIIGGNAAGWVNHNNGHKLSEGQAIPAGVFGGALLLRRTSVFTDAGAASTTSEAGTRSTAATTATGAEG